MVRHKNRYIVVEINHAERKETEELALKPKSLHLAIFEGVQRLHGDFGAAAIRAGFTSKYCNSKTRIAVIRCRHGPHKLVASTLPFINSIEGNSIKINMLYTGATIKQCFNFLKRYQQTLFDNFCAGLKTDEEKLAMRNVMFDAESILAMV